jgi:lipopolysaccharide biosynthesis glycosyltransferase
MSLVIISVFNYGAIHLGLNHLQSLRRQGITNYKAYVTDTASVDAILERGHPVEYIDPTVRDHEYGIDGHDFGTKKFNVMSYLRYKIINKLLAEGKTVWYMDVDTVVLKNVNSVYDSFKNGQIDMVFQNDINMPCTGCMLCFPTDRTKQFLHFVLQNKREDANDQILIANILRQNPNVIKFFVLDINTFPNGLLYFMDELDVNTKTPYNQVIELYKNAQDKDTHFVHANWMVGNDVKMQVLKKYKLWFL